MQNDIDQTYRKQNKGKIIAGFVLLVVGGILLLEQIGGFFFPSWLFSWPMWLIVLGLYCGAKHNFQKPTPYIMVVIGVIFLLDDIFPGINITNLFWPIVIISIGIMMILGRNHKWDKNRFKRKLGNKHYRSKFNEGQWEWDKQVNPDNPNEPLNNPAADFDAAYGNAAYSKANFNYSDTKAEPNYISEDYLDATSVFGSVNKTILSKNFKGGEIVNVFGGAEIDFTQSDINGRVIIDVTQIFGGIKLLVPPHWHVVSDSVALFAGFDDKRKQKPDLTSGKVLMITGSSIFAGIEIRSY